MAVITVSRELGSDGDRIVDLLRERLGYCQVDKSVLSDIAEQAGVNVKAILEKERLVATAPRLISSQMTSLYGRAPNAFRKSADIDDQTYARVVREAMERYARQGDTIIVGRGGQMVLRDWPGVLHVHLYAPVDVRVQRLMSRSGISKLEAKRRIKASDERKRLYIRHQHRSHITRGSRRHHLPRCSGAKCIGSLVGPVERAWQRQRSMT